MKRITMLLALCVFAVTATMLPAASTLTVHLPYAAQVGEKVIPAGDYTVNVLTTNGDIPVVTFQSKSESAAVLANRSESVVNDGKAELVLDKKADSSYRLIRVVVQGAVYQIL